MEGLTTFFSPPSLDPKPETLLGWGSHPLQIEKKAHPFTVKRRRHSPTPKTDPSITRLYILGLKRGSPTALENLNPKPAPRHHQPTPQPEIHWSFQRGWRRGCGCYIWVQDFIRILRGIRSPHPLKHQ